MKPALIVIDMINDFVIGVFKNDRAVKIIPNIKSLLAFRTLTLSLMSGALTPSQVHGAQK
jgi:hypothetical protein